MKTITVRELYSILLAQPETTVLDVRTPVEFQGLHVARAYNIPLSSLNPKLLATAGRISQIQPIYLLCQSGRRAKLAAQQFTRDGFENTVVVEGGTQAWKEAGLPVERGETEVISLERQVRVVAGSLVLIGVAGAYFIHPGFIGLSAFVGAGLVFAGVTDWCGMVLLLARLPWNNRPVE